MKQWRIPIAGAVVALLLIVGYYFAFYQPRADEIAQVQADAELLRTQQAELTREIAALGTVREREDEFRTAAERLDELIPAELAQPSLLEQLRDAADAAGVELVSVTFGAPLVPEAGPETGIPGMVLVEMGVTIVADGSFSQSTALLREIELDVDRAVLVESVSLVEAEAGLPQLTGTWSGRTYALLPADHPLIRDPDAPPAETAPAPESAPDEQAPDEPAPDEPAAPEEPS